MSAGAQGEEKPHVRRETCLKLRSAALFQQFVGSIVRDQCVNLQITTKERVNRFVQRQYAFPPSVVGRFRGFSFARRFQGAAHGSNAVHGRSGEATVKQQARSDTSDAFGQAFLLDEKRSG